MITGRSTQIRARVHRRAVLNGQLPLVVYLHGNHSTCGRAFDPATDDAVRFPGNPRFDDDCAFTDTGACAAAFPIVVPSFLGYEYLGQRMASHGFIVVSIDANRGITCAAGIAGDSFLIRARGNLVLEHLRVLSDWHVNGGTPASVGAELQNHIDFANVGLMGHSRGGEGVRAAFTIYGPAASPWPARILRPVSFRGIFEIGPTDNVPREAGNTFNALGTVWNVLLPMCDADVNELSGVRPFDRMHRAFFEPPIFLPVPFAKFTYTVWGTNHNFYNTEWQVSDTDGNGTCIGPGNNAIFPTSPGSAAQRLTALSSLPAFFRSNVGAVTANLNRTFNPLYDLPPTVVDEALNPVALPTRIERGYTPSSNFFFNLVTDDFNNATGTSSNNVPNQSSKITIAHNLVPRHDADLPQRAGLIDWAAPGQDVFFQANMTAVNAPGRNVTNFLTLDFRVSRQDNAGRNPGATTDFSVRLVAANGVMTRPLRLSDYGDLRGPVGGDGGLHPILKTIRMPLRDFGNLNLVQRQVRGVRFIFDQTASGAIHLANIRFLNIPGAGATVPAAAPAAPLPLLPTAADNGEPPKPDIISGTILSIVRVPAHPQLNGDPGVDMTITASRRFAVSNAGPILNVGSSKFYLSRFERGDTRFVVFTIPQSPFDALPDGAPVVVDVRGNGRSLVDCGPLNKTAARQR